MADLRKYVAVKPTRLTAGISAVATSVGVAALQDIDGNTITMSDLGDEAYGVFEPKSSSKREIFKITGISSTTMTVARGGSAKSPYTFSGTGKTHSAGTQVVFYTNAPQLYDTFANKYNDETIVGDWTFDADNPPQYDANPTFGSGTHEFASVKFVEDTANAGAANGSTTVKGLFEEATQAEIDAGTAAGGTSARLAVNPSTLATSIYGTRLPSSAQKTLLDGITASAAEINLTDGLTATTAQLNEAGTFFGATDITGAEAETLTAGPTSNADAKHTHEIIELTNPSAGIFKGFVTITPTTGASDQTARFTYTIGTVGEFYFSPHALHLESGANDNNHATVISTASSFADATWDKDITIEFAFKLGAAANIDAFIGIGTATAGTSGVAANSTSIDRHIGLYFDDAALYASVADGTTQQKGSDLASGLTLTEWNTCKIVWDAATSATFYINDSVVATRSTNIPSGSTSFGLAIGCETSGSPGAVRSLFVQNPFRITFDSN